MHNNTIFADPDWDLIGMHQLITEHKVWTTTETDNILK